MRNQNMENNTKWLHFWFKFQQLHFGSCFKFLTLFKGTDERFRTCKNGERRRKVKSSFFSVVNTLNARLRFKRLGI